MLKLMFLLCLVTFFNVVKCDENIYKINVTLKTQDTNGNKEKVCMVEQSSYTLKMDDTVQIVVINEINSDPHEPFFLQYITENNQYNGFQKKYFLEKANNYSMMINSSYTDYNLTFYFTWNNHLKNCSTKIQYENSGEVDPSTQRRNDMIIFIVIGVLCVLVIIAETALILYCRSKFIALSRHNNLTRLKEEDESDGDRYSTNPKKKDKTFTPMIPVDNRQSEIYEEPNINIGAPPPVPPGIPISRSDHSNTSTLKMPPSPQINGNSFPTFPRPKHPMREPLPKISVADRPPLPLPDNDEFYSEAVEGEDVYEQPPILQSQQSKKSLPPTPKPFSLPPQQLPLPQKPTPQQKQFPSPQKPLPPPQKQFPLAQKPLPPPQKQLPPLKEFPPAQKQFPPAQKQEPPTQNQFPSPQKQFPPPQKQEPPPQKSQPSSLKNPKSQTRAIKEQLAAKLQLDKPLKPPVSQAKPTPPRNKTAAPAAARMPSPPAPKPQPNVKPVLKPPAAKPKTPPMSPTLEQQVQFFNQHRDDLPHNNSSDDDEWTYEPLYNI